MKIQDLKNEFEEIKKKLFVAKNEVKMEKGIPQRELLTKIEQIEEEIYEQQRDMTAQCVNILNIIDGKRKLSVVEKRQKRRYAALNESDSDHWDDEEDQYLMRRLIDKSHDQVMKFKSFLTKNKLSLKQFSASLYEAQLHGECPKARILKQLRLKTKMIQSLEHALDAVSPLVIGFSELKELTTNKSQASSNDYRDLQYINLLSFIDDSTQLMEACNLNLESAKA